MPGFSIQREDGGLYIKTDAGKYYCDPNYVLAESVCQAAIFLLAEARANELFTQRKALEKQEKQNP